ncbi:FAD-dependent monooxygenase [Nocardia sp. NBC_01499]|uniref:FAD-dependent monooxygenase n=1 Tax=Nocardia sp. NBC_01499 TaxID=2903597 RepID=UPI003862F876
MASASTIPVLPIQTEVLIVGAGPAGLTLAASLRLLGVDHVVIDHNSAIQSGSKAAAVQPRALEYLDRIGVSEHLVQAGVRGRGFCVHDRENTLLRACYDDLDTPYPYVLLISQQDTEKHLLERLAQLGGMVHRDHQFLSVTDDFPGIVATISGPDGALRAISARYLVGCDGVHSAVRTAAGIDFPGAAPEQWFAIADVHLSGAPMVKQDTTFFLSPAGMLLVSPLAGGQYRIVAPTPDRSAPRPADIERLLVDRGPRSADVRVTELVSASTYRVQERVAQRFRAGPIFLVGDAAHTHSPAGGQGMNTGIQDAGNLAWKLQAVLNRFAPDELLDSYHRERHPVAAGLVAFTSQFAKLATVRDPAAGRLRNEVLAAAAAVPGVTEWIAAKLAQLDIGYTEPSDQGVHRVGQRVSPTIVPSTGLRWTLALPYGIEPRVPIEPDVLAVRQMRELDTALLIRPDGYLAAHGAPADVADHLLPYLLNTRG